MPTFLWSLSELLDTIDLLCQVSNSELTIIKVAISQKRLTVTDQKKKFFSVSSVLKKGKEVAKSGNAVVRWQRVNNYLGKNSPQVAKDFLQGYQKKSVKELE